MRLGWFAQDAELCKSCIAGNPNLANRADFCVFVGMSHFGTTLRSLMQAEDLNQTSFESRCGVDASLLSRIISGRAPSRGQLVRIIAAISTAHERRVELLLAYLRDEASGMEDAGIDSRHLVIRSAADESALPGTLGAELELIGEEAGQHDDVRQIITDLARMLMRHRAELADVYPFPASSNAQVAESPILPSTKNQKAPRRGRSAPVLPSGPSQQQAG